MPPISFDGDEVSGITIDGDSVEEVSMDGDVVWEGPAIPDSENLHTHYDATTIGANDGQSVGTWADEVGNNDLSATGDPTYLTGEIGGNSVVRYDGVGDYHDVQFGTTLTQTNHIFTVARLPSEITGWEYLYDGWDSNNRHTLTSNDDENWQIFSPSAGVIGGSDDTNPHIFSVLFNSPNSVLRIDGAEEATGDIGTDDLTGIRLGADSDGSGYTEVDIGEILIYENMTDAAAVEYYLSNKWGVTI